MILPVFALSLSLPLRAAEVVKVLGPLRIKGEQIRMIGPALESEIIFDRPGWIKRYSTTLLDSDKNPAPEAPYFCHMTTLLPQHPDARVLAGKGLSVWKKLSVGEGQQDMIFPEGFGLRVEPGYPYHLGGMLYSEDPKVDAEYYFRVAYDIVPLDGAQQLIALEYYSTAVDHGHYKKMQSPIGAVSEWLVPHGTHVFKRRISLPIHGRVHYAQNHLHRYATRAILREADSGKVVFNIATKEDSQRRILGIPAYSSKDGFPVSASKKYEYLVTYDNPTTEPIAAMATLHLFVAPE